jgi:mRNA interferase MazF
VTARVGQVWVVDLDPVVANEQGGTRPCLVISSDHYNAMRIAHAIVAPVTSRDRGLPHHVPITGEGGLDRPSFVMPEGAKAVSTTRFVRQLGEASPRTLETVRRHVRRFLGG